MLTCLNSSSRATFSGTRLPFNTAVIALPGDNTGCPASSPICCSDQFLRPYPTAGIAFSFTPLKRSTPRTPGTPSFTPSKVLLANGETRMNMLSPAHDNTKLYHADVEYQKIVSEWQFQKDSVDIPQVRRGWLHRRQLACG